MLCYSRRIGETVVISPPRQRRQHKDLIGSPPPFLRRLKAGPMRFSNDTVESSFSYCCLILGICFIFVVVVLKDLQPPGFDLLSGSSDSQIALLLLLPSPFFDWCLLLKMRGLLKAALLLAPALVSAEFEQVEDVARPKGSGKSIAICSGSHAQLMTEF
jgi:hypothetical protein